MTCSSVKVAGHEVILCGKQRFHRCVVCGEISLYACDWKVDGGTCDAPMCEEHRHNIGKDKDLCWRHMNAWKLHPGYQHELTL